MEKVIKRCRLCGNSQLRSMLNLGKQCLTGVFPDSRAQRVTSGHLELVQCDTSKDRNACGLLQLKHSCSPSELYGSNYGYRSGLNVSMVTHLQKIVRENLSHVALKPEDIVLDIGSNDGTLLSFYPSRSCVRVGMDPTAKKFAKYYHPAIKRIPDFFSVRTFQKHFGKRRAKIVTSIAMFYDLESPLDFAAQIHEVLEDDGIWVFEQSYMPLMLERNAYDTICHEHIEYYGATQIQWIFDRIGFRVVSVELNDINGGSFRVTAAKKFHRNASCPAEWKMLIKKERGLGKKSSHEFRAFKKNVENHRNDLTRLLKKINRSGKKVLGYGASTKGNVILQYCGFTPKEIPFIAEVNADKFGCFTPGTRIPIISEKAAKALVPDYFLVFPWHFKTNFLRRERAYLNRGGKLIFPLPKIEIVGR